MRQNVQSRGKELSCPKGFPKAGRQLIRKSWVATGMLNDLVASKSLQVHKLRVKNAKAARTAGSTDMALRAPAGAICRYPAPTSRDGRTNWAKRKTTGGENRVPRTKPQNQAKARALRYVFT